MKKTVLGVAAVLVLSGCYHVTVDTGRAPSGQTVEKKWAHAFLGGLVPPETVETASGCPSGVAKVESKLSFLNLVAAALTGSLYTPMTITVQCAAGGGMDAEDTAFLIREGDDAAEVIGRAAVAASETGETVLVRFQR